MHRRTLLKAAATTLAGTLATPAIAQGNTKVLRCAPEANLASIDPIWTTATVAINHGYMVYDTLYGTDLSLTPRPQMAAGHTVSDDKRTWTFTLREGLAFHDGEPVRAADCVQSIDRWSKRAAWGQALGAATEEMKVKDDKTFVIQLKKPFSSILYALGVSGCFIMPERVAKTDPFKQITDATGSGPFKFVKDEWVAGAKAVWVKNDKYVPRNEAADFYAGGKRVFVDRVEHVVMPDGATAAAALQTGEVDWVHVPQIDLVPMLKKSSGVTTAVYDPLGWLGIIRPNFLFPPFDNRKLLRAILPAIDQREFLAAVVGEQADLGKLPAGFFTAGGAMANMVGMEALTGPRDVEKAKRLVGESGYKGEPVLLMSPTDQPALEQVAQVTRSVFEKVGINVKFAAMDWSTLVSRRASREPPDKGGWNAFCTSWAGLSVTDPGGHFPIRGNGAGAWFGWPTDAKMEALRDAWFDAPDLAGQKKICEDMQAQAFDQVPFIPVAQWFYPTAFRNNIVDIVKAPGILHWNLKKT
ncbi:MAG TPA: ABC transporter substrate-binding protein [Acetobacteraceae bacterium]|nr:ABC transporter substrate-binding protein [Acetobacteraceae bacterium]